jgi:hypothetical protein
MTTDEEIEVIRNLKVRDRLMCKKSWSNPIDPMQSVDEGTEYDIVMKDVVPHSTIIKFALGTWGGDVEFYSFEISRFFHLPQYAPKIERKCDCGFVVGESAAHYRWCDTLQVIL